MSELETKLRTILQEKQEKIIPENIKEGVQIFDIVGTMKSGSNKPLVEEKVLNLYDYDGTLLYSYTKEEALNLEELPTPNAPDEILTFQEWNWSLDNIKSFVRKYPKCNVGATYIPTDRKTHAFITIPEGYSTSYILRFKISGGISVLVDWGDGATSTVTSTSNTTHVYESAGSYEITFEVNGDSAVTLDGDGSEPNFSCFGRTSFEALNYLTKIYIGDKVTLAKYAFMRQSFLKSITIPNTKYITYTLYGCFMYCKKLEALILPKSVTLTDNYLVTECYGLRQLIYSDSITIIGAHQCSYADCLSDMIIPESVTSIGSYFFESTRFLKLAIIGGDFGSTADEFINNTYLLKNVYLSDKVTIMNRAFINCRSLENVYVLATTPPTNKSTREFYYAPNTLKIYVPTGTIEDYKAATNWSSFASKFVEYDYDV